MISRETVQAIARQPVVMSELIINLSTDAFLDLYADAKVDEPHPLDSDEIIAGVLERGDSGKKLVIARYARIGGFMGNADHILAIASVSLAHKCALLANPRVDWHMVSGFGRNDIAKELLVPILCSNDAATEAFLTNPRSARELIATAIRGRAPFGDLELKHRLGLGFGALRADYIDSPNYPGKDAPDSNELDFDKPNRAFLAVLKESLDGAATEQRSGLAGYAFGSLVDQQRSVRSTWRADRFSIESEDWLLSQDKASAERISDWSAQYWWKSAVAGRRLAEWAVRLGEAAPSVLEQEQKTYKFEGGVGDLAIFLALKGLQHCRTADSFGSSKSAQATKPGDEPPLHEAWLQSPNWVAQAAAVAFMFETQIAPEVDPKKREELAVKLIQEQAPRAAAAVRGLSVSRVFWGLVGSSYDVRQAFTTLAKTSPETERTSEYVSEYLGDIAFRGAVDQRLEAAAGRDASAEETNAVDAATANRVIAPLSRQLDALAGRIQSVQSWIFWGFLILAAILIFRR